MGGGGGEGVGDFRAKVWSMSGGPYCRPKHWRRNTAFAMLGVFLVCIPIAMKSAELEVFILLHFFGPHNKRLEKNNKRITTAMDICWSVIMCR